MTNGNQNVMLFVTHVNSNGQLLRIWGQINQEAARQIETLINILKDKFDQGVGSVTPQTILKTNTICCAFHEDNYYRAEILAIHADYHVHIKFIDYGNDEIVCPSTIRLLDEIPEGAQLQALPPIAYGFAVTNIVPFNNFWVPKIIEHLKHSLRYGNHPAVVNTFTQQLVKLDFGGQDFFDYMVMSKIGMPAGTEQMFNAPKPTMRHEPPSSSAQFVQYNNNNFMRPPHGRSSMSPPKFNNHGPPENWRQPRELYIPPSQRSQPATATKATENLPFKCRVLELDSIHQVRVSHIEDGPLRFVIQLQNCDQELETLMRNINNHPVEPLLKPELPGYVCLGRCSKDKCLRRAVINSATEGACQTGVYYVDFGDSELLPFSDIYELPPQYVNPRVLSVRFCLTGIRDLSVSMEMKKFFADFVRDKLLTLKVQPVEDTPLIQYCTLHDGDKSVLDTLKEAFPDCVCIWPQQEILPRTAKEMVHVAYVEAPNKFFVQLDKDSNRIDQLTKFLATGVKNAPAVKPTNLKPGFKCLAHCAFDKQWYRAEVINATDNRVTVHYVDYGNDDILPSHHLRCARGDELMKIPALAIQCTLNGYDAAPLSPTIHEKFEGFVLDKPLVMTVVDVKSPAVIVELYDSSKQPIISISSMLRNIDSTDVNSNQQKSYRAENDVTIAPNSRPRSEDNWTQKTGNIDENRFNSQEHQRNNGWSQAPTNDTRYAPQTPRSDRNFIARDTAPRHNQNDTADNDWSSNNNRSTENRGAKGKYSPRADKNTDNWCDKDSNASSKGSNRRGTHTIPKNDSPPRRDSTRSSNDFSNTIDSRPEPQKTSESFVKNPIDTGNLKNLSNAPQMASAVSSPSIPPPNITLGAVKYIDIVYSTSPSEFYVQLSPDNSELDGVMTKITEIYENGGIIISQATAKPGVTCVAQYSQDFTWYRAMIESIQPTGAEIRFVDYGNTELVSFDKLKQLQPDLAKLPTQAIACRLLGVGSKTWNDTELMQFTTLTDGKRLEAEFIAVENNIYEVLIREINEDKYINEDLLPGVDLLTVYELTKNKSRPSRVKMVPTAAADYPVAWIEHTTNIGSEEEVMVTWIQNPDNFYVQCIRWGNEFREMMKEIQKVYHKRTHITDQIDIGTPVMAVFAEDGAIYRAEVVDIKPAGVVVKYVDFGNRALVQKHEVYRVDKEFMKLPQLGIHCALKGVKSPAGKSWDKFNTEDAAELLLVDGIHCVFSEAQGKKFIVELKSDGQDLAAVLVKKGVADFIAAEKIAPTEICDVQQTLPATDEHLTQVDVNFLMGQTIRVNVSNVEKVNKFHIELPSAAASNKIIADYMANTDPQVMPKLLSHEVCLGSGCLVQTDDGWKRTVVINCSRTTSFQVRFIDSGAIDEIPLERMLTLPGELAVMQKQAVECCLKDCVPSAVADERLKAMIEHKEVIIQVDKVENTRLVVRLFDEAGRKLIIPGQKRKLSGETEEEHISPICPLPLFTSNHRVTVSHINHSGSIWLKRIADAEADATLLQELYDYYSSSGKSLNLTANKLCAAQSADGNWYRATTISRTESGALVHFIDYGNSEEIPADLLKELEPVFCKQFALAIETSLPVQVQGSHEEQAGILNTYLLDKEFTAAIHNIHGSWLVELTLDSGIKFIDDLYRLDVITTAESQQEPPAAVIFAPGVEFAAAVTHSDSPTQFWLHRASDFAAIESLQEKLQSEVSSYEEVVGIPPEKLLCAVLYSVDNNWYRAEVIDADEGVVTVRFIDYGNTDVIVELSNIKHLPSSLKSLEFYAIKCRLDVFPTGDDWSEAVTEHFEAAIAEETLKVIVLALGNPMRVDLIIKDKSISESLVAENLALKLEAHEELIDEVVEVELDPRAAFVSHVNSPSEFWVQEEKSVGDLELISDRFLVAPMFATLENPSEGTLCVAKFPEDQLWYRARVVSSGESGTNVIYIDYGNSATSTEVREIPEDLAKIPPLSRKSCLALPPDVEAWSSAACAKFCEMSDEGATVFILDVLEEGETSIVRLSLNEEDIVTTLAELCEKKQQPQTPKPEEIVQQKVESALNTAEIESENESNAEPRLVYISQVYSPTEFFVQEDIYTADINAIVDILSLTDEETTPSVDLHVGRIVIAKFPEDSHWYRAQILSLNDNEVCVLFIDYGNSAIATEIREIPSEIASIPPLARKCSLAFPAGQEQWSSDACSEFIKLVNNGETAFMMKIIQEGEISMVTLNCDGQDVTTMLTPPEIPTEEIIEARLTPLGEEKSPNVVVSHVVSPGEFWTQAESKILQLETMIEHMLSGESFLPLNAPEEGSVVAALFPEDGNWYRAKILCHGDTATEVLYIDYGNTASTTEIRALRQDLIDLPALSKFCALKKPAGVDNWSVEACQKFFEMVADGATMFDVQELGGEEPTLVNLILDGVNVAEILAPLCKGSVSAPADDLIQQETHNIDIKTEKRDAEINSSNSSGVDGLTAASELSDTESFSTKNESSSEHSDYLLNKSVVKIESVAESTMIESTEQSTDKTASITIELSTDEIVRRYDPTPSIDEPEWGFEKSQNLADATVFIPTEQLDEEITSFMNSTTSEKVISSEISLNKDSSDEQMEIKLSRDMNQILGNVKEIEEIRPKTPLSEKLVAGVVTDPDMLTVIEDEE